MRSLTCGICGNKHKMYAKNVEKRICDVANSGLVFKCKKCNSTLNKVRLDGAWTIRWFEAPNMKLSDPIFAKDI